jgi:hypothetical protein
MRDAVRGVAARFPTAIVSGRCRDKVKKEKKTHNLLSRTPPFALQFLRLFVGKYSHDHGHA